MPLMQPVTNLAMNKILLIFFFLNISAFSQKLIDKSFEITNDDILRTTYEIVLDRKGGVIGFSVEQFLTGLPSQETPFGFCYLKDEEVAKISITYIYEIEETEELSNVKIRCKVRYLDEDGEVLEENEATHFCYTGKEILHDTLKTIEVDNISKIELGNSRFDIAGKRFWLYYADSLDSMVSYMSKNFRMMAQKVRLEHYKEPWDFKKEIIIFEADIESN